MSIPVARPYECAAPPLRAFFLVSTWSQWSIAHPERPATVDSSFFGEHGLAWLVVLALGSNRLREELPPCPLGVKGGFHIFLTRLGEDGHFAQTLIDFGRLGGHWVMLNLRFWRRCQRFDVGGSLGGKETFQALLSGAIWCCRF